MSRSGNSAIDVWREKLRERPAVYINGAGDLVAIVAVEAIAGGARFISVALEGETAIVTHDAPVDLLDGEAGLLHDRWPGSVCARAASTRMVVETCARGRRRSAVSEGGRRFGPIRDHGPSDRDQTRLSFTVARAVVGDERFDASDVRRRLGAVCLSRPGVRVRVDGDQLVESRGLSATVAHQTRGRALHPRPLRIAGNRSGVQIDIALQWGASGPADVRSVVASLERDPGVAAAFRAGLLDATRRPDISDPVIAELLEPGLVAVVALDAGVGPHELAAIREVTREGLAAHRVVIDRVIAIRSRSTLAG